MKKPAPNRRKKPAKRVSAVSETGVKKVAVKVTAEEPNPKGLQKWLARVYAKLRRPKK